LGKDSHSNRDCSGYATIPWYLLRSINILIVSLVLASLQPFFQRPRLTLSLATYIWCIAGGLSRPLIFSVISVVRFAASHALRLIPAVFAVYPSTTFAMDIRGIIDIVDHHTGFPNCIDCTIILLFASHLCRKNLTYNRPISSEAYNRNVNF
jgi:hypothetical protein